MVDDRCIDGESPIGLKYIEHIGRSMDYQGSNQTKFEIDI